MLGIIGAMDVEVKKLREMMEDPEIQTVAGMTFYQGTIKGKAVVVVRSGIGKVNAGLCSQILVDRYHVSGIINTGIAGSLRNEVNVGEQRNIFLLNGCNFPGKPAKMNSTLIFQI